MTEPADDASRDDQTSTDHDDRDDNSDGTDEGEHRGDPHARPPHEGLPFGDNPQERQGEDPASGGS